MEFYLVSAEKLKVTLNAGDMEGLGISYESMDYADPLTRKTLIALLEQGREETGFHPRKAKLFIEVYPSESGGCVLYFTCLRADGFPSARAGPGPNPVVFEFDDADVLIDACVRVRAQYGHRILSSSLYAMKGDRFRLVVYPLDYSDRLSVYFLSEYGRLVGEGKVLAAYTDEHGRRLVEDSAIDQIATKLGESNI